MIRHCGYDYVADSMDFISNQIAALLGDGETSFAETAFAFFKVLASEVAVEDPKYTPALRVLTAYLPFMIELVRNDNGRWRAAAALLTLFRFACKTSPEGQRRVRAPRRAVDSVLSVDNDEDAMVTAGTSEARRKAAASTRWWPICEVGVC